MLPLYFLFPCCILLTILAYQLNNKRMYSPSFMLCLVFSFCSFFALLGDLMVWKEEVSFLAPSIILSSLCCFIFGERLAKTIFAAFKSKKNNIPSIPPSQVLTSTFVPPIDKTLTLSLIGTFLVQSIIMTISFFRYVKIAQAAGYTPYALNLLSYLRDLSISSETGFPVWLTILDQLAEDAGFVCLFLFPSYFFTETKKAKSFLFLLPVIPMLISLLLSTARVGFLMAACVFWFSIFFSADKVGVKINIKQILIILVCLSLIFSGFYAISGRSRGAISSFSSLINSISVYTGSSIVAFDKWLRQTPPFVSNGVFGNESFFGLHYFFDKFFNIFGGGTLFCEFIRFTNGQSTNVYTAFRSYIADFGLPANYFIQIFLGFFYGILFQRITQNPRDNSVLQIYYPLLLYYLVMSAFSPLATSTILMEKRLAYVTGSLLLFILYRFFFVHDLKLLAPKKNESRNGFFKNK